MTSGDVTTISAYLFHAGGHENPYSLKANTDKSFIGSYVLGMGFTFDDMDAKGVASPISEMRRLLAKDAHNADRIYPYLGGEEINDSPTHSHHRYVINFGQLSEDEARGWPDLMAILEERVKPERMRQNWEIRSRYWWRFGEATPALFEAIRGLDRVLVVSRVRATGFTFLPSRMVFSEQLVVFPLTSYAAFCTCQSRPHEVWSHFFSGTALDLIRYAPSDCFETFPMPVEAGGTLEVVGKEYYDFRAALMVHNNEGLTKTYNRFHDPNETSPDILKLRELHAAMDRAVLDAYGWTDLKPTCEFLLDYEEEDEENGGEPSGGRGRKKPWRYRWPDEFRDEVLARLLELNKQRAEEEAIAGQAAEATAKATGKKSVRRKARNPQNGGDDRTLIR